FHKNIESKDFELTLSTWLDLDRPESWNGVLFWMGNNTRNALGVRWQCSAIHQRVNVEFFHYQIPHLQTLATMSFSIQESHWHDFELSVHNNLLIFDDEQGNEL